MKYWRLYLGWWLSGSICGICLAELITSDIELKQRLLTIQFGLLVFIFALILGELIRQSQSKE